MLEEPSECRTLPQVGGGPWCEEDAGPLAASGPWGVDVTYAQDLALTFSLACADLVCRVDPACCPGRHALPAAGHSPPAFSAQAKPCWWFCVPECLPCWRQLS